MNINWNTLQPVLPAQPAPGKILIFTGGTEYGSHVLDTFVTCPQLFAYIYVVGLPFEEATKALIRGTLIHVGLAHYYAQRGARQPNGFLYEGQVMADPSAFYEPAEAIALAVASPALSPFERAAAVMVHDEVQKIIAYYLTRAPYLDSALEVVAVEHKYAARILGCPFTGRVDLVVRTPGTPYRWYYDHKTAFYPPKVHKVYSGGLQINGLQNLGRATFGNNFRGVKINYLIPAKALRGEPDAFVRLDPDPAPGLVARMPQLVFDTWHSIRSLLASKRDPYNWPIHVASCRDPRWERGCPAWNLCSQGVTHKKEVKLNEHILAALDLISR